MNSQLSVIDTDRGELSSGYSLHQEVKNLLDLPKECFRELDRRYM